MFHLRQVVINIWVHCFVFPHYLAHNYLLKMLLNLYSHKKGIKRGLRDIWWSFVLFPPSPLPFVQKEKDDTCFIQFFLEYFFHNLFFFLFLFIILRTSSFFLFFSFFISFFLRYIVRKCCQNSITQKKNILNVPWIFFPLFYFYNTWLGPSSLQQIWFDYMQRRNELTVYC